MFKYLSNQFRLIIAFILAMVFSPFLAIAWAEGITPANGSVELNGDTVEYAMDGNKITAKGHVVIIYNLATLICDQVEFYRDKKVAYAEGNVHLISKQGEILGNKLMFNFDTMTGEFNGAKIISKPFYGEGRQVSKVDQNKITIKEGYVTTCDFDKPHFRLSSRRIEMYPGDKLIAHNVRMIVGNVPLIYLPKFNQSLKDKKPRVLFTPGYKKDWGIFLLQNWRYYFNDDFKGVVHLDYRERKGFAPGVDLDYNTRKYGSGLVKLYYMNELNLGQKHFWQPKTTKTIYRERFKAEWKHKWDIDEDTQAIAQFYKLSDADFLKDYFRKTYEKESSPDTFFLLTKTFPKGTLSFRTDGRINRFESKLERLPEIRYDLTSQKIGETGLVFDNTTIYSNFSRKDASPTEVRRETMRLHLDNIVSYPFKLGFIELKPFVGERTTYYSKTLDPDKYGTIRGIFRTGASLSTKFYKALDWETNAWGLDIHRLRHIITPSIAYEYDHEPTRSPGQLDQFDSIDALDRAHKINFGVENKLQTKRNGQTVELLRVATNVDFLLKDDRGKGGFNIINSQIDFRPADWLTLYADSAYDTVHDQLSTANFDLYINHADKWSIGVGKRLNVDVDDQVTSELKYKINHKWSLRFYDRFDVDRGIQKAQEFTLTRDLHEWLMDVNFNETRGEGSEIWIVFTLKDFPDFVVDIGTGFNKRKAGSQSSGGE